MATSSLSIGDLLSTYPTLQFDLEEYILSRNFLSSLQGRWEGFLRYIDGDPTVRITERSVLESLRNDLSENIEAYASLAGAESFGSLPLINKGDLLLRAREFCRQPSGGPLWSKTTSGTTGAAATVIYSPAFYFAQLHLSVRKIVASLGDRTCWREREVWCVHITDTEKSGERIVSYPTARGELSAQILVSSALPETLTSAAQFLDHFQPLVVTSRPELLEMLVGCEAGSRYFENTPPRYVISSGSTLNETRRLFLDHALNTRVVNAYGLTEFGLSAWECENGSLHVDETTVIVEVLLEDNTPAQEGDTGELVLSSIDNNAMPLIRYKTGDRAQTGSPQCCGMPGRVLEKILGRQVPCFRFSSDTLFSPTIFNDLPELFAIKEYQITQVGLNNIEVIIEPRSTVALNELNKAIFEHVRTRIPLNVTPTVRFGSLSDGSKFQRYRQTLYTS